LKPTPLSAASNRGRHVLTRTLNLIQLFPNVSSVSDLDIHT
jgi:hypothetical protein